MCGLFYYCWSYKAYTDSLCWVFPPRPDQLPLAAIQTETWRIHSCLGYVGRVYGVSPPELRWLSSLCEHLLRKAQEGLPVPVGGNSRLGSPSEAPTSDSPNVWFRCNSEQLDHDPMLLERPETFRLGPDGCPKLWLELLRRGRRENRQREGKGNTPILLQYPRHGLEVSQREQAH